MNLEQLIRNVLQVASLILVCKMRENQLTQVNESYCNNNHNYSAKITFFHPCDHSFP